MDPLFLALYLIRFLFLFSPDAFDFSKLDSMDERERLDHAFSFGEKQFKIIKILDSSDVYVERPDKKLIILCLSHWYDYLEGSKAKERQEVNDFFASRTYSSGTSREVNVNSHWG